MPWFYYYRNFAGKTCMAASTIMPDRNPQIGGRTNWIARKEITDEEFTLPLDDLAETYPLEKLLKEDQGDADKT